MSSHIAEFEIIKIPLEDMQLVDQVAHLILHDLSRKQHPTPARVEKQKEDVRQRSVTLGVFSGEQVIATGGLEIDSGSREAVLQDMVVAEGYRREGLGGRLLRALEEQAIEEGMERLAVTPALTADGFYLKMGYGQVNVHEDGLHATHTKFLK